MNAQRSESSENKALCGLLMLLQMWQYLSPWSPRASSHRWTQWSCVIWPRRSTPLAERDTERGAHAALVAELKAKQLKIDQLTHEMAILKRWHFDRRSEQMDPMQRSLLDESIDADIEAISLELEALKEKPSSPPKEQPRRVALPAVFPRREIHHEPENTQCSCGCGLERIGEDVSEKLDYTPGVFEVERHIRGKWVCRRCERLIQAPVPPHVIDKGIPTAGLLAQVLIAKYLDHAPLYRQEAIFGRAGLALPRSTLAQWVGACGLRLQPLVDAMKALLLARAVLHADETPVPMLKPGLGRTHRAYLWSYSSSEYDELKTVIYDFTEGRGGVHARDFLGSWSGKLVCDDYSGYKALFDRGVTEAGCMAHARRKLHDLYANHRSEIAEEGLRYFAALYEIEGASLRLKLDAARPAATASTASKNPLPKPCASGSLVSVGMCRTGLPHARQSTTAWDAGQRLPATSKMAICRSTTTTSRTASAR